MNLDSILSPERTFCNIETRSKKMAIEKAAIAIAATLPSLKAENIYNQLIAREKLGPTALGDGVALPHCRLDECNEMTGALFTLAHPIDFGAFDDVPVHIMFVLLVPSQEVDEHLKTMAMLAEKFGSPAYRESLLAARDDHDLFERALVQASAA